MLTGSMAMGVYTISRSTQDFDFVVQLESTDVSKLVTRFAKGYYCNEDSIDDTIRQRSMFNIIDHASGFKADFIILKANDYQQVAFGRKAKVPLLDTETYVISGEDLIPSKLMWIQQSESGRQKEDIVAVAQNSNLDWGYIRHWIAKLNLRTFSLFE